MSLHRGSCHCGAVTVELTGDPHDVCDCNCSVCRRLGALWSYHSLSKVRIEGALTGYRRGEEVLTFWHCPQCGCTTHWSPIDLAKDRMGVNMRLFAPELLARLSVYHHDGASA
ncbi:GFA family protein [Novosphingobium sp. ST904]|uniref:GFA family protein n=1 Tax=Novosphingobium sp. ST904 TaxID=1684385 RepID=UPI0009EB27D5|nr:GFA family protein [Novosphingobium sp. ST904]TCM39404.1 hypothetical protein EDF59_106291 [Novosphingobium sp. ST904]